MEKEEKKMKKDDAEILMEKRIYHKSYTRTNQERCWHVGNGVGCRKMLHNGSKVGTIRGAKERREREREREV